MQFSVLFSSSSGNATVVRGAEGTLLIDAGTNCKQVRLALESVGATLEEISAICVTHDHTDHVSALRVLEKKLGVPVCTADGTMTEVSRLAADVAWNWWNIGAGEPFEIAGFSIEPFAVSHDGAEPLGFVITENATGARLGFTTDLGSFNASVVRALSNCNALVLEFNHDLQMLRTSGRPWPLIRRIEAPNGHLSNDDAATLLSRVAHDRLRVVVPAHISHDCNTPALAVGAAESALHAAGCTGAIVIPPNYPLPWIEVQP